jgi:transposase-like protein
VILGENGLAGQLKKMLAERMLSAELSHHPAHESDRSKNHRNGSNPKKLLTPGRKLNLDIPRDSLSSFEPKLVAKHQRRMRALTTTSSACTSMA